ncbi:hypothetical protein [Kocuria sp. U4B]
MRSSPAPVGVRPGGRPRARGLEHLRGDGEPPAPGEGLAQRPVGEGTALGGRAEEHGGHREGGEPERGPRHSTP